MSGEALKNNPPKSTGKKGGARPGAGRKKGIPNKLTMDVKTMILAALDKAGGADYLFTQAAENPTAFMTLIGKVLPLQIAGDAANPINVVSTVRREVIDPRDAE